MPSTKLVVRDQVNVKFENLDPVVRRKLNEALKYEVPGARHMPQVKLGRWDGTISFCTIGGGSYLNLLDRLLPIVEEAGYDIEIEDKRPVYEFVFPEITDDMFADKVWPKGHRFEGEPIMLRDYQVQAIKDFTDNLQSIQEISTGAGKTLMTAGMSSLVEPYGRSIVIVPNKSLVSQTEKDYKNLGLDVGVFYGDRKEWNHQHTICTWQSLSVFDKKSGYSEVTIDQFIEGVICVIVDEAHSAKGKELRALLTGAMAHIPIRWGLTGSIPKEDHEAICLFASIGPKVGEIRAADLQAQDVLANCKIDIVELNDDHVEYRSYDDEHDFLLTDTTRLKKIASLIHEWAKEGNTLVLVDRVEAGEILKTLIPDAVFVYGKTKEKKRQEEYASIQTADNKPIIATYGVAAVGIDIPRLFNIVLFEAGKSFIRTIQSIGRGLRRANDKEFVHIRDLCSSLKFSKRHAAKRRAYYNDAQYPYVIRKINYL